MSKTTMPEAALVSCLPCAEFACADHEESVAHVSMPSPVLAVGDRDLVQLSIVRYESEESSGSSCANGLFNPDEQECMILPPYAIRSGPRKIIYWEPQQVRRLRRASWLGSQSRLTTGQEPHDDAVGHQYFFLCRSPPQS